MVRTVRSSPFRKGGRISAAISSIGVKVEPASGRPVESAPGDKPQSILDLVGHTPLVPLNRVARGFPYRILAKLEYLNPGGSVKDRIGPSMVDAAEKKGLLKPGGTIIEATSGNTGVGLALVAAVRGYHAVFVIPDKMSSEKIRL